MKSFYSFITERKRNPGRPGSQGPSETERAKSKAKTSRPTVNPRKPLTIDQILRAGRPEGAAAAVGADEAGVYIGSDKDAIKKAIDQERVSRGFGISKDDAARYAGKPDTAQQAKVADDLRSKSASPTVRRAASNIIGGGSGSAGEELVGGETAKSGTGGSYRQRRPSEVKASAVSQGRKYSGSLAKGTLKFPGDAKYRQELEKLGIKLGDKVKRTSTSTTTATPTRVTSGDIDLGKVQSKSIKTSVPKVNVTTSQNIDLGRLLPQHPNHHLQQLRLPIEHLLISHQLTDQNLDLDLK